MEHYLENPVHASLFWADPVQNPVQERGVSLGKCLASAASKYELVTLAVGIVDAKPGGRVCINRRA